MVDIRRGRHVRPGEAEVFGGFFEVCGRRRGASSQTEGPASELYTDGTRIVSAAVAGKPTTKFVPNGLMTVGRQLTRTASGAR